MSSFLRETLGAADSGVFWDVGNFKLWQSTRPDTVLFTAKTPTVVKDDRGRYQVAVSAYNQQQPDRSYKITGGSAMFCITTAPQFDSAGFAQAQESWRQAMGPNGPANPKFVPLNTQKSEATVLINPMSGVPDVAHNDKNRGTPGGAMSFLVNLTELGAQEWVQGIRERTAIPASVMLKYEYLRMMPTVGAEVKVWGRRMFRHISAALDVSVNGFWYGGSAKIEAAWNNMVRNGDIEVTFFGQMPPELEQLRQEMVTTFANQAREQLFASLFRPAPDVKPAQAGNTSGIFGGANFAFKYQREEETTDLSLRLKFEGMTWLQASIDAPLGAIFNQLDPSYVTEVQTQQAFDSSIVVDGDPIFSDAALSISYSEGHAPEAPVFGPDGGTQKYVVVSRRPNDVLVKWKAKINYAAPRWAVINASGEATVAQGGNQIVIKPSQWVGRHYIYMFVRDGDEIVPLRDLMGGEDYLVVNVSYTSPHLRQPIKDSAQLTPDAPLEFAYPMDPEGRPGVAKFSAFGVIRGKLVRASDQVINRDEEAVFVLASRDGIQLVSKNSVLPESDNLAQRLLTAGARPVVEKHDGGAIEETERPQGTSNGEIQGMVRAVEYSPDGPAMWIMVASGEQKRVRLRSMAEADRFDDNPKRVRVKLDRNGEYADSIVVELSR